MLASTGLSGIGVYYAIVIGLVFVVLFMILLIAGLVYGMTSRWSTWNPSLTPQPKDLPEYRRHLAVLRRASKNGLLTGMAFIAVGLAVLWYPRAYEAPPFVRALWRNQERLVWTGVFLAGAALLVWRAGHLRFTGLFESRHAISFGPAIAGGLTAVVMSAIYWPTHLFLSRECEWLIYGGAALAVAGIWLGLLLRLGFAIFRPYPGSWLTPGFAGAMFLCLFLATIALIGASLI